MFHLESERIGFDEKSWEEVDTCLWGVPPLAPYHAGYDHFVSAIEFLSEKGVETEIVFPRLHVQGLDDLDERMKYYATILEESTDCSPEINTGRFQLEKDYLDQLMDYSRRADVKRIRKSLPDIAESCFESLLPLSQILDPVYLDKDMVLAGAPQRRVYALGRDVWEPNEKKPLYFIELAKDVKGRNLRKSDLESRINIHDSREEIERKLKTKEDLENIKRHSISPPAEEINSVDKIVERLVSRFRRVEQKLEEKKLTSWLDRKRL